MLAIARFSAMYLAKLSFARLVFVSEHCKWQRIKMFIGFSIAFLSEDFSRKQDKVSATLFVFL